MTIRLNSRCLEILSLLVSYDAPLAATNIASRLNLSPRMVRTSLSSTSQWLQGQGISLSRVPGRGYSLLGSAQSKKSLAEAIRTYDQPLPWLSSSERLYVVLLALFFAQEPIQIKQLQEALNLSRTTTIRALDAAEKWLEDHHLELVRKPNYGSAIVGEETNWREAAIRLLLESAGDARLLAQLQGVKTVVDVSYRTNSGLEEALGSVWTRLDFALIRKAIAPILSESSGPLSDQMFIEFFICLSIAVYRSRAGRCIHALQGSLKRAAAAEQLLQTRQLAAKLEKQCGIRLPESEVAWIAQRVPETNAQSPASDRSVTRTMTASDRAIQRSVDQIVIQASLSLHPSLSVDLNLIRNLTVRVRTLLEPQEGRPGSRNPLLQEVKSRFPYVFAVARQSSLIVADRLRRDLTEAEVGDIAVCLIAAMERLRQSDRPTRKVLVVCSEGAATAWLLVSRLRTEFPDIDVVDAISALELENRKHFDGIDFIVSTIPLRVSNTPTRQVSPLLGLEDCRRLRELFERREYASPKSSSTQPSLPHLSDLLTAQTIEVGVAARTWQEVVDKAGSKLLQCGAVEERFIAAMKKIILEYGPYMVIWPGAVLLHAPPHGVRRLCMGLISLKKPVRFGHAENDPVRIAVVLGAVDNSSHISALLELNRMMQDERARSAIQDTGNKSVVLHWISLHSRIE
jgi:mannitol operon transcriptional antiterminator